MGNILGDNQSKIKLSREYKDFRHDYLYSDVALPMFEIIADWIIENKCKTIIEPGCGAGHINNVLHDKGYTDYTYIGYDTCSYTIQFAQEQLVKGQALPVSLYNASWYDINDKHSIPESFDCMLLMGVLPYGMPYYGLNDKFDSEVALYKYLTRLHHPNKVFIRDVCPDQTYVHDSNEIHTINTDYFDSIADNRVEVDLKMWLGHKVLYDITIN